MPVYLCSPFEVHPVYQYERVCCLTINTALSEDYGCKISERCHIAPHTWKRKHTLQNKQLKPRGKTLRRCVPTTLKEIVGRSRCGGRFNELKEQAVLVLWRVIEILKSTGAGPTLFTGADTSLGIIGSFSLSIKALCLTVLQLCLILNLLLIIKRHVTRSFFGLILSRLSKDAC